MREHQPRQPSDTSIINQSEHRWISKQRFGFDGSKRSMKFNPHIKSWKTSLDRGLSSSFHLARHSYKILAQETHLKTRHHLRKKGNAIIQQLTPILSKTSGVPLLYASRENLQLHPGFNHVEPMCPIPSHKPKTTFCRRFSFLPHISAYPALRRLRRAV